MLEEKNQGSTSLSSIGEFGLINHLTNKFKINHKSTVVGIGDDAAVINNSGELLVTTDMLIEGVHFDLSYVPLKHLGYKSVMVNLSDVYAMNGNAKAITVSIAASNRFPLEALEELYNGIKTACDLYNIDLIGGDTTSSTSGLIISITAIGNVAKHKKVLRSTAKANNLILVSGDLGGAFLGLKVLEREKEVFKVNPNNQPDLDQYSYIIERQLKPEARKDIIELLTKLEVQPTSMIDISDGLSSEILHLINQSNLGCRIYEDKIPLDPTVINACEEFNLDSTTIALNGGEDYELLFTIKQEDYSKIKGNPNLTVIGHMSDPKDGSYLVTRANELVEIKAKGWRVFNDQE